MCVMCVCGVCVVCVFVCVCVCVLDRFVECLTGLPTKVFQTLNDTLRFSAPVFFAVFRAVLNWLQTEVKGAREPNHVILSLENLKEKLRMSLRT